MRQFRNRAVTFVLAGMLVMAGAACSAEEPVTAPGQEEGAADPGDSGQDDVEQGGGPEGAGNQGSQMTESEGDSSY